jgi:uncharacterized protein YcaQ
VTTSSAPRARPAHHRGSQFAPAVDLSIGQARRLALRAQGFGSGRKVPPTRAVMLDTVRKLGAMQIDSVNVLVRSHYLPVYSRHGPYDVSLLDDLAYGTDRQLFEYWGHEASLLPVELQPLLRWRMDRARRGVGTWSGVAKFGREHRKFCTEVLEQVRTRGPLGVSELGNGGRRRGGWWGWSRGKVALEWLFWSGAITTHSRRRFERIYDVPDRTLPIRIVQRAAPDPQSAQRELLRLSIRALGVATERDLRDYFRLPAADAGKRIPELVESGDLVPARVEGWKAPAFVGRQADETPLAATQALLSPFDSLIWERQRTERLFDFRYRLEIYTPAHRREHGYYVLPFLLGDRIVARVDLKADRTRSSLKVVNLHVEPHVASDVVREPLRDELGLLAAWLGLRRVTLSRRRAVRQLLGAK